MKKLFFIAAIIMLGIVLFFIFKPKNIQVTKQVKPDIGSIATNFRATGSVSPRNRLEIKPAFAGRIEEVLVVEGDKIKKGQVIIWMSSNERAAMIDAARATSPTEYKKWLEIYKPTPIMSPMDGFIILRNKEPGQTVTNADPIVVMADDLIIESDVDETDLRHIKIGGKFKISLDAYPDEWFNGTVEHIAYESSVVNNVTVYKIRIKPDIKPEVFRAGMTATIIVVIQEKENALLIPSTFITEKSGKHFVNIKTLKGHIEQKEVNVGISDGKNTEILSGVTQADTVVMLAQKTFKKQTSALTRK